MNRVGEYKRIVGLDSSGYQVLSCFSFKCELINTFFPHIPHPLFNDSNVSHVIVHFFFAVDIVVVVVVIVVVFVVVIDVVNYV